ncbi:MAG: endonuclease domain-containing protein [Patescibacteria group bacterium]
MWKKLRARRFHGLKFRRQVPIGQYIVDFLCVEKNLIIEIDGSSHCYATTKKHDRNREEFLKSKGFEIIRFSNSQSVESTEYVLSCIREYLGIIF